MREITERETKRNEEEGEEEKREGRERTVKGRGCDGYGGFAVTVTAAAWGDGGTPARDGELG